MATVSYFEEKQLDVTLNYVDIVSRIEVLEAEKVALTSLLEKATTTADILAIRSQLEKVIEELICENGLLNLVFKPFEIKTLMIRSK